MIPSLIAPFDIFCQQEVNWIYNKVPESQQVTWGTRKSYISVSAKIYPVNVVCLLKKNKCKVTDASSYSV